MIRIIPLLISFLLFFSVTELHASAAEKWEYEPVMKDMNIHVKAYKVDQYGNAVNDYEYNTKIDTRTKENKIKAGNVGFGRLLKSTGWGLLGAVALEGLLESIDWVLDPEAQSIWRYKKPQGGSDGVGQRYCPGYKMWDGKGGQVEVFYWSAGAVTGNCPLDAAEKLMQRWSSTSSYGQFKFIEWMPDAFEAVDYYNMKMYFKYSDPQYGVREGQVNVVTRPLTAQPPQEKEYLSPEKLGEYINKTHPDFTDPYYQPRIEPKYSPQISNDIWTPANQWEYENSPTVKEVQRKLDQAQPEPKKDAEIKPNPETGGSVLPKFCDWAASICDFIDWFKQPPETPEAIDVPEKELEQKEIKKDLIVANVRSCPADIHFDVQNLPFGIKVNKGVQMQPICDTIEPLKYVFQLFTLVLCGFILLRV